MPSTYQNDTTTNNKTNNKICQNKNKTKIKKQFFSIFGVETKKKKAIFLIFFAIFFCVSEQ